MIIGIDGNEANVQKRVGISEYAYQLILEFSKLKTDHKFIIYLKDKPISDMPTPSANFTYRIIGPRKMWTQFGLPLSLYFGKRPDIFFSPTHYAPRFSPIPTAIAIMDLSYIYFPDLFNKKDLYQLQNWSKYSIKNAAAIFTISNSSQNDIIKEYAVDSQKIHPIYLGIKSNESIKNYSMDDLRKKFGIESDYILFVGTLQPRKNITRLIEAFSQIKNDKLNLVIVGKRGWQYTDILSAPEKYGIENKVKFLDFVADEDLPSLYKNAVCFALPSLYEGFGLPVLEAMKFGCPVVTSNVSSLPEAGGDAALYFDPNDTSDIAKVLTKVISDAKLREEMIKKGYNQIKKFSWEKTAKETLNVLESIK